MQDRYLYKAKRLDNGEWVEGFVFDDGFVDSKRMFVGGLVIMDYKGTADDDFEINGTCFWEVDPDTICRYTGRKDKNGTLIWENDIVCFLDVSQYDNGYSEHWCIGKVVWDDETLSFQVTERISCESYEVLDGDCEVAGNKFDNPELLEE